MRDRILQFLKNLEKAVPPPPMTHHAITFAQYGNDEEGWEDRLGLQVNRGGKLHCFFLDDADFDDTQATIETIRALSDNPNSSAQFGISLGRYS